MATSNLGEQFRAGFTTGLAVPKTVQETRDLFEDRERRKQADALMQQMQEEREQNASLLIQAMEDLDALQYSAARPEGPGPGNIPGIDERIQAAMNRVQSLTMRQFRTDMDIIAKYTNMAGANPHFQAAVQPIFESYMAAYEGFNARATDGIDRQIKNRLDEDRIGVERTRAATEGFRARTDRMRAKSSIQLNDYELALNVGRMVKGMREEGAPDSQIQRVLETFEFDMGADEFIDWSDTLVGEEAKELASDIRRLEGWIRREQAKENPNQSQIASWQGRLNNKLARQQEIEANEMDWRDAQRDRSKPGQWKASAMKWLKETDLYHMLDWLFGPDAEDDTEFDQSYPSPGSPEAGREQQRRAAESAGSGGGPRGGVPGGRGTGALKQDQ